MKPDNWWSRQLAEPPRRRWPNVLRIILGFGFALAVTCVMLYASVWLVEKGFIGVTAAESFPAP